MLNDVCRCHDAECPDRETCARWVYRQVADRSGWASHAKSLRHGEKCDSKIEIESKGAAK
jgi:hypothetical protein